MRLHALARKTEGKEVIKMLMLNRGIVMLAALNMIVNSTLGLMILVRCSRFLRPLQINWPERLRNKLGLKSQEKGEQSHEKSVE